MLFVGVLVVTTVIAIISRYIQLIFVSLIYLNLQACTYVVGRQSAPSCLSVMSLSCYIGVSVDTGDVALVAVDDEFVVGGVVVGCCCCC